MKNFKKVLALVLVVVMALGLISTTNAAFTDADSITKTEAVEVLNALGVIGGYPEGNFKPEGDVTRAEMAKMVAFIMNEGQDEVGNLFKDACPFTDAANHWAAGYIAYCANEGIISGKSPTKFDPDGKVTGIEAAKMLLCALGYDADTEGFKGATWGTAVLGVAQKAHLVGKDYNLGNDVNMGAPLSRENAAQMILNALKATVVEYKNTSTITIGNVVVNNSSEAKQATQANFDNGDINKYEDDNIAHMYPYNKLQLGEVKFEQLFLAHNARDDFKRPGEEWTYLKNGFDSIYPIDATVVYKDTVTGGKLYTDLGKIKATDYYEEGLWNGISYFVDGINMTYETMYTDDNGQDHTYLEGVLNFLKSGKSDEFGDIGDTLEVYLDVDNLTLRFVQINYYAAELTQVWAEQKDADGDVKVPAYVKLNPYIRAHKAAIKADLTDYGVTSNPVCTIESSAFTAADKGSVVVYTIAQTEDGLVLESAAKATAVTGVQKGYSLSGDIFEEVVVDSTTYKVAVGNTVDDYGSYDSDITVYLDPNGNVIYAEAVASNNYAYVLAAGNSGEFAGDKDYKARLLFPDGTTKVVATTKNFEAFAPEFQGEDIVAPGWVVSYSVRTDGKYVLSDPTIKTVHDRVHDVDVIYNVGKEVSKLNGATYSTGKTSITDGVETVNVNDSTIFVVESVDDEEVSTYTVYTGLASVPSITGNGALLAGYAKGATFDDLTGDALTYKAAAVVYLLAVKEADVDTGATSEDMVVLFKTANDSLRSAANDLTYRQTKAIVNGEVKTLNIEAAVWDEKCVQNGITLVKSYKTNSNGVITSITHVDAKYTADYADFEKDLADGVYTGVYADGIITLDGESVAVSASTPLYLYNKTTKVVTITTIDTYYPSSEDAKVIKVLYDKSKYDSSANILDPDKVVIGVIVIDADA